MVEERQAVVEFVIAQSARVKTQRAHGLVHRQLLRARNRLHHRFVVRQRGALDGVAVVHQQRVGKLLARRTHQRGGALEAVALVFGQLEVVVAAHIEVQVGGLQHRQCRRGRLGLRIDDATVAIIIATPTGHQQRRSGNSRQDVTTLEHKRRER
ncbi:hypothetical protein SDC9_90559 [bioreactor metagenome]|uniref:Uncharacterized protein n=1 Tax=bioreactor metagenome TaxID=1076179 RepID=A0A644ZSQ2_9ZZZZ